jgi:hypothetical protein
MTGILILESVEVAYCDQCGRPCVPGVFRVFNWHHKFRVCDVCLQKLASDITAQGEKAISQIKR